MELSIILDKKYKISIMSNTALYMGCVQHLYEQNKLSLYIFHYNDIYRLNKKHLLIYPLCFASPCTPM